MTNPFNRRELAHIYLKELPPLIRMALLDDSNFRAEYGFMVDATFTFGDYGLSVRRSDLFKAIRTLLSGKTEIKLIDTNNQKWRLQNINGKNDLPRFKLSRGMNQIYLPSVFALLSQDQEMRLRFFDKAVSDVNLPHDIRERWYDVLAEHELIDEEFESVHNEFQDTPVEFERSLHNELIKGKSSIASLVPHSRRYYERLVGKYDGSVTISDYAATSGRKFLSQLPEWRSYDGFLFSLLLSSHASLTTEIDIDHMDCDDIIRAFEFVEKYGDRFSQLGAIEVGLRIFPEKRELETTLIHLIEQIRDDDVTREASNFKLLSSLFILIDGELSLTRLLSTEPPFYRRLAALSQAALIHRQLVATGIDIEDFCEWANTQRVEQFYLQSLADMRIEPRWYPEYANASKMKTEFLGRIFRAVQNYEQNINGSKIAEIVSENLTGNQDPIIDFFNIHLPSPLEAGEETQNIMPIELTESIESQLNTKEIGPSSFVAMVNSALIFKIEGEHAQIAAKLLKQASYRLANLENRAQLLSILNGLASVAAIARSQVLADELRVLVRRYRNDAQYKLSINEAVRICLVAAACHNDPGNWREYVGDWLTEFAFSDLEGNEGVVFHHQLQYLCHVVPELWVSCGRADAALMAYCASGLNINKDTPRSHGA